MFQSYGRYRYGGWSLSCAIAKVGIFKVLRTKKPSKPVECLPREVTRRYCRPTSNLCGGSNAGELGGSAILAIDSLKSASNTVVKFVCLVSAPFRRCGSFTGSSPDVEIFIAAILDGHLNETAISFQDWRCRDVFGAAYNEF